MRQPSETEPPPPIPFGGPRVHDDLLDRLIASDEPAAAEWWIPDGPIVVLGRFNRPEAETHAARCQADGVPIVRRLGGGGAVFLDEGTLCVTAAWRARSALIRPADLFRRINETAIATVAALGLGGVRHAGVSDWAFEDRKLAGSSLYAGRAGLLYQLSILLRADGSRIDRYLAHPSREPDYRRGRRHGEFLTSAGSLGFTASAEAIGGALVRALSGIGPGNPDEKAA